MTETTKRKKAGKAPAAPTNTKYIDRILESLALLCAGNAPPRQMVIDWETDVDEELQSWAVNNAAAPWATGIGTIEAAQAMANTPEEGMGHELREDAFPRTYAEPAPVAYGADLAQHITLAFGDDWALQLNASGNGCLSTPDGLHYVHSAAELDVVLDEKLTSS